MSLFKLKFNHEDSESIHSVKEETRSFLPKKRIAKTIQDELHPAKISKKEVTSLSRETACNNLTVHSTSSSDSNPNKSFFEEEKVLVPDNSDISTIKDDNQKNVFNSCQNLTISNMSEPLSDKTNAMNHENQRKGNKNNEEIADIDEEKIVSSGSILSGNYPIEEECDADSLIAEF